jgi:hypothetical protein
VAPAPPLQRCQGCAAPILWARWAESGKAVPVDAQVTPQGNLVLSVSASTGQVTAATFSPEAHRGRNRYVAHFATCPQAKKHRRGK